MAFSTDLARRVGVYEGDYAQGSHDWDTLLRIAGAGEGDILHVPEVLYGWRVHPGSTAGDATAKDYVFASQEAVISHALMRRGLAERFRAERVIEGYGLYRHVRSREKLPAIRFDYIVGNGDDEPVNLYFNLAALRELPGRHRAHHLRAGADRLVPLQTDRGLRGVDWIAYDSPEEIVVAVGEVETATFAVAIVSSDRRVTGAQALADAVGVLELDRDAAMVAGPVLGREGVVLSAGYRSANDERAASPFVGWDVNAVPRHLWEVPTHVVAAPIAYALVRSDALVQAGGLPGLDRDDALNGLELAKRFTSRGSHVVHLPQMTSERDALVSRTIGEGLGGRAPPIPLGARWSPYLSQRPERFGLLRRPDERAAIVIAEPFVRPLNLVRDLALAEIPTLNLLIPNARMAAMSGGPNTALNLAYRIAALGFPLRIIATDVSADDEDAFWNHLGKLADIDDRLLHVEIVDGSDRATPVLIGSNDVVMATAWWTAQMAKEAAPLLDGRPFLYLIQDFEPLFYPGSDRYALALETYDLDHVPILNTRLLNDYFADNRIGRFADPAFAAAALSFEPAVSRDLFYAEPHDREKRRLLFYARPKGSARNLYDIGVAALRAAIADGVLSPLRWQFLGMGEAFEPVDLGWGAVLECAPWRDLAGYAEQMRSSDLLLSLMLSPHPSYPPLEMAACGGLVVTTTYGTKTAERLRAVSPNLIAVSPTVDAVAEAIREAVALLTSRTPDEVEAAVALPRSWGESFASVLPELADRLRALGLRDDGADAALERLRMPGAAALRGPFERFLDDRQRLRERLHAGDASAGLLSFVTTVWNTPAMFLEVLARSVRDQAGGAAFEWLVLDNGTTRASTLAVLDRIKREGLARVERVEQNLGIVGGMRYCLERASGRYILPLDSDDFLVPDTVRTVAWHLHKTGYPALLYTDEAMLRESTLFRPYLKPDWDPVLFANSCYIAHLCAIDREEALACGAYTDPAAEGCHDWDTVTRLTAAGHWPVHVPEVLYGWRMHSGSTAGDFRAKPAIFASHQAVLARLLEARSARDRFTIEASPLFDGTPDWWLRRRRIDPPPITTVRIRSRSGLEAAKSPALDHEVVDVPFEAGPVGLIPLVERCARAGGLVHLLSEDAHPDDDEWSWEAAGLFELFPDAVAVGGRIHAHGKILGAGFYLGFGSGCNCPDHGRPLGDGGYFVQLHKPHSVSAVSGQHVVVKADFLLEALVTLRDLAPSFLVFGRWLGACARRAGRRVIYSPFVSARTTSDWDSQAPVDELARFAAANADLMPDAALLPPHAGRTPADAYQAVPRPGRRHLALEHLTPHPYRTWFETSVALRGSGNRGGPSFSILTAVYQGTDPELFSRTASSVAALDYDDFEWIILAHGPIADELATILTGLARRPRCRVLRLDRNLGIVGGMRHLLQAAQQEFIVPLDGDDLLTPDCLSLIADGILDAGVQPDFVYTDEDVIVGDDLRSPFLRPSWDPVLDLENSWIWHACAFRRDVAITLGVYTDPGAEYCHDWDTVDRFSSAGSAPLHVPGVTYHWRHHQRSTSNRERPDAGSIASVRHVLARKAARRGLDVLCEVVPLPVLRGGREWRLRRKPERLPPLCRIVLGADGDITSDNLDAAHTAVLDRSPESLARLESAVAGFEDSQVVLLMSNRVRGPGVDALAEAVKLFECHDDVVAVCGRVLRDNSVIGAPLLEDGAGHLRDVYTGRGAGDEGPFSLGTKAQSVAAPIIDLLFLRAGFLREALRERPPGCLLEELGLWLGAHAQRQGRRIAYSPFVAGTTNDEVIRPRDETIDALCWSSFTRCDGERRKPTIRHGTAAYELHLLA